MPENEILRIIKQRRSVRRYQALQIKDEELKAILEAGRYAPYGGTQSWHFTAVQNKGLLTKLNTAAKAVASASGVPHLAALGNSPQHDCLHGAPTLILVSADSQAFPPLDADCAAANQNMLLAAESLGVSSCWIFFIMMAFMSPQTAELLLELQIPGGYKPLCAAV
ncbi:MAG: nitroreductase family protein, partial [Anaerolineae bacterium]